MCSGLLKDAVFRSIQAATLIGLRALVCHAIDDEAAASYCKHGYLESPSDALTLLGSLR